MLATTPLSPSSKWINVENPTPEEQRQLVTEYEVTQEMLEYAIDPDERARVEVDQDANIMLLIFDVFCPPISDTRPQTAPVSFMFTTNNLISFTSSQTAFVDDVLLKQIKISAKTPSDTNQLDIILPVLYHLSTAYFEPIHHADKKRQEIQTELQKKTSRNAIDSFVTIETGLVYILTSLRGNTSLLLELKRRSKQLSAQQQEILDDVIVEAQQGLEMAQMTSDVIDRVSNAYSKVLDNDLNNTMKFLTVYSIVLTIPSIVFGFFGQNVAIPFEHSPIGWELTLIVMLILAAITSWMLLNNHFWKK